MVRKSVSVAFKFIVLLSIGIIAFQNCSQPGEISLKTQEFSSNIATSIVPPCGPSQSQACRADHGQGIQFCSADGQPLTCQIESCDSGFQLLNGSCLPRACQPGTTASCVGGNGSGSKTCNATGTGFGACVINACDVGFNMQNGVCVANACVPNSNMACTSGNGAGNKVCNGAGTGYGACVLSSCNSGFNLQNGMCVANVCTPNSITGCMEGNGSGTKTCNSTGTGFGACQLNACNSGYNLQNGTCVANLCNPNQNYNCSENNGSGQKMCNALGTGYGACQLTMCNGGYNLQNGSCVANACTPNATVACSENNGVGTKTCNAQGTAYGSCQISSCAEKYVMKNGVCLNTCFSNIQGNGTTSNPYQIKNETDFLCMNQFSSSNLNYLNRNWLLKADLKIDSTTYPRFGETLLRKTDDGQFILVWSLNSDNFDGGYHKINYVVNCSAESDQCKNPGNAGYPKKDIAIFATIFNSTVSRLKVEYDYSDIGANGGSNGRASVQYTSGLTLDTRGSRFFQVSTSGVVGVGPQLSAGITVIESGGLATPTDPNTIEQCYSKITAVPGAYSSAITDFGALTGKGNYTLIKDSYAELGGLLRNYGNGATNGITSYLSYDYQTNTSSKIFIQNSYIKVSNNDANFCLPQEFMGSQNGSDLGKNTVLSNSFWVSPINCDKRTHYPSQILPLPASSHSSAIQSYGWDSGIWVNGPSGLPQLRWLATNPD